MHLEYGLIEHVGYCQNQQGDVVNDHLQYDVVTIKSCYLHNLVNSHVENGIEHAISCKNEHSHGLMTITVWLM